MTQLVIKLDDKLASDLYDVSEKEHIPQDILVADLLRRWLATRWLKQSQAYLGPLAKTSGYDSEEDVLSDLS
jgi:hypothetical protein